jgi:c-di-GMP-binding flagellar brake protein YcgR
MQDDNRIERRRTARCPTGDEIGCRIEVRARVRVLDISATGALLAAETLLPVGSAAHLKTGMGSTTFSPEVQIRREARVGDSTGVGVSFTTIDERSRRSLEQFLKKASA